MAPDDTLLCLLLLLLLQSRRQVGIGYDNGPFTKDYSFSSSCSSNAYFELQQEQQLCEEQRWVPYRHTNGVAIYHHKESKRLQNVEDDLGSEYMASSIVRGLPDECLDVLMHLGSHTTILGPASRIQLLEDGAERQVRRLLGGQEVMEQWGAGNSHGCSWLVDPGAQQHGSCEQPAGPGVCCTSSHRVHNRLLQQQDHTWLRVFTC
jgi:hypothetical protein